MVGRESEIQDFLMDWKLTLKRIEELKGEVRVMTFRVTATYNLAPARSVGKTSKAVEDFCVRKAGKEAEIRKLSDQLKVYDTAIMLAGLSDKELGIVHCLKEGIPLSEYAAEKGIYQSYVYKVKDRTMQKIGRAMKKARNGVFLR